MLKLLDLNIALYNDWNTRMPRIVDFIKERSRRGNRSIKITSESITSWKALNKLEKFIELANEFT